jgi:bifunctional DNase/RNase
MGHIIFGDVSGIVWFMRPVDISGIAIDVYSGAPLIVLREQVERHRLLPFFIGAPEASAIAIAATGQRAPRPLVHDLMSTVIASLDGAVQGVEVTELQDGTFYAAINLTGPAGNHSVDSRPSDALALAVRTGAPVFVSDAVLDEAGSLPEPDEMRPELEPAEIDAEVDTFRSFLDDIDPSDFTLDESSDHADADSDDSSPTDD